VSNYRQHNIQQHNRGAATVAEVPDQHPFFSYSIETRSAAGVLTGYLRDWSAGSYKAAANEHSSLTITLPYTAAAWALVSAFQQQIWLRDDRGRLLEKFHIMRPTRSRDAMGNLIITVDGVSLISHLSDEVVPNFMPGLQTQSIVKDAETPNGTFTLGFGGQATGAIAYNASAATVQSALTGLSTIGAGIFGGKV